MLERCGARRRRATTLADVRALPAAVIVATVSLAGVAAADARESVAGPRFEARIAAIDPAMRMRMRFSWRPGCPVGLSALRLVTLRHWNFDGGVRRGELVVHRAHARRIVTVFRKLFGRRFPIARMRLVDAYRADDDRSMAANNTSAFNCRFVSGTSRWSEHAYGRAIDINPVQNPYVAASGRVSPPGGTRYADRSRRDPGMIQAGDGVIRAFAAIGWRWGGSWSGDKDYHHFSSTGR